MTERADVEGDRLRHELGIKISLVVGENGLDPKVQVFLKEVEFGPSARESRWVDKVVIYDSADELRRILVKKRACRMQQLVPIVC